MSELSEFLASPKFDFVKTDAGDKLVNKGRAPRNASLLQRASLNPFFLFSLDGIHFYRRCQKSETVHFFYEFGDLGDGSYLLDMDVRRGLATQQRGSMLSSVSPPPTFSSRIFPPVGPYDSYFDVQQ